MSYFCLHLLGHPKLQFYSLCKVSEEVESYHVEEGKESE